MADVSFFEIRPAVDARPLDLEAARRLAHIAGAEMSEADENGIARLRFGADVDAATAEGRVQLAARMELGAHWQTRYRVVAV
jgi:hypothetical protein